MSFIPIIAKADITANGTTPTATTKKGKITPEQMAQFFAFTFADKVGILDCLNNCLASQTSLSIGADKKATAYLKDGYILIYGRLVECEFNTPIEIDTATIPNGKIILSVDLSQNVENEIKVTTVSSTTSLADNDLNENPTTGKYDFELYSYTSSASTVSLTRNNENYIKCNKTVFQTIDETITDIIGSGVINQGSAPLEKYNKAKGTIEERLSALGFKNGSVTSVPSGYAASVATVKRQGNYCILNLSLATTSTQNVLIYNNKTSQNVSISLNWENEFAAKTNTSFECYGRWSGTGIASTLSGTFKATLSGTTLTLSSFECPTVVIESNTKIYADNFVISNFGYEAQPL